tara:strand:+ start:6666 stop:7274 length:609 start_codon:yes stop_codon:yes gene_type:complete
MVKLLELFCGSKSVGKVFEKYGWEVVSLDIEKKFDPSICIDFMDWDYKSINDIDIIWSSPDCSCYSMAAGNRHFNKDRTCKTEKAEKSLLILKKLKACINYHLQLNPKLIYFIENPRARMRWFNDDLSRYTVCYCKYGFDRMKPTDIWTNIIGFNPMMCKNNNPECTHIRAPRGSKSGTQGIPKTERYKIPPELIEEFIKLL